MAIDHTPLTSGATHTTSRSISSMNNPGKSAPAKALAIGQTIRGSGFSQGQRGSQWQSLDNIILT